MSDTPEQRREAQSAAIAALLRFGRVATPVVTASAALNGLLAYFGENEPAVADAIRFGLRNHTCRKGMTTAEARVNATYDVLYPKDDGRS